MFEAEIFILSERALAAVIDQISDGRWSEPSPSWFQVGAQRSATLREIVNYHAYDSAWVPDVLAGRTIADVGSAHDHVKTDPHVNYRVHSDRAIAAAAAMDDPNAIVHLSYGDYPAREYLTHVTSFRGFRAYDIAKWIGVDTELPAELVQGMWEETVPAIETWRAMGVYGTPAAVPDDAPLQDRLLGMVGRDPYGAR